MSLESAFNTVIDEGTAIAALVSERHYHMRAPAGNPTFPYLVWEVITHETHKHLSQTTDFATATIQVSCIDSTYAGAIALRAAVYEDIQDFTASSGTIWTIRNISGSNTQPNPQAGEPVGPCVVTEDYEVWYRRAIPGQ